LAGTVSVTAQINANLDPAGSYLMVDGTRLGTMRVSQSPYVYALDTTTLSNGNHTLQIWAHDTSNNVDLSATVSVTVANSANASTPTPAPTPTPTQTPPPSSYPITLAYPVTGQGISGVVSVAAIMTQALDAAGSCLMVDGAEWGFSRVGAPPYVYPLDTSILTPGQHTLQVWAHDLNNETLLSNPVAVTVTAP
jgi:hypothetical protein